MAKTWLILRSISKSADGSCAFGHYKSIKSQRSADKEVILNLYSISITPTSSPHVIGPLDHISPVSILLIAAIDHK